MTQREIPSSMPAHSPNHDAILVRFPIYFFLLPKVFGLSFHCQFDSYCYYIVGIVQQYGYYGRVDVPSMPLSNQMKLGQWLNFVSYSSAYSFACISIH